MNVLEFLEMFKSDERFINTLWPEAFVIFNDLPNKLPCTENYFRTKYNNERRGLLLPIKQLSLVREISENETDEIDEVDEVKSLNLTTEYFEQDDLKAFDPQPIKTGTYGDRVIGQDGGFARASVNVFVGGPGAGKTSTLVALACEALDFREQEIELLKREYDLEGKVWDDENPPLKPLTATIIHGEMRKKEWMVECHQVPYFYKVGMIFLRKHRGDNNYVDVLRQALASADIVIVDSFPVILSHMKISYPKKNAGAILYEVIDLFTDTADESNNVINVINQVNKDGQYKGGTDLVHMVSSLCYFKILNRHRFLEFEKNRNGGATINQKLFFDRDENKRIRFNEEAYETTYFATEDQQQSIRDLLDSIGKESDIELSAAQMIEENNEETNEELTLLEEKI